MVVSYISDECWNDNFPPMNPTPQLRRTITDKIPPRVDSCDSTPFHTILEKKNKSPSAHGLADKKLSSLPHMI